LILSLIFSSCQKLVDFKGQSPKEIAAADGFTKFTIKKGQQSSDLNYLTKTQYEELKFKVKFDNSAIYTTTIPENQWDINKLYGFADNDAHHQMFSARFGWNWNDGALSLFAYTYNNGKRESKLLGPIKIGEEVSCSIKVAADKYIFTHNGIVNTMPRSATTTKAIGYKLYPYFGGDEMAPHDIFVWIKETL
jgi:hypothetical protein